MIRRMSKIMLKLRDLKNGEASVREFDDESQTIAFLKERPPFTDVLGVVFDGLTPDQNNRLRAAVRPLDATEKAAEKALEEKAAKEAEAAAVLRAEEDEKSRVAHREAMKTADPHRSMEVRYHYTGGIGRVDAGGHAGHLRRDAGRHPRVGRRAKLVGRGSRSDRRRSEDGHLARQPAEVGRGPCPKRDVHPRDGPAEVEVRRELTGRVAGFLSAPGETRRAG